MTQQHIENEVAAFQKIFAFDETAEMYYPADYSKGLPAPHIKTWLKDTFTRIAAASREEGHKEGYEYGQKHAFGVDRERVRQEGFAAAIEAVREKLEGMKCRCNCEANNRLDRALQFLNTITGPTKQ